MGLFITLWPRRILSLAAAMILGFLIGGATVNALFSHRLEEVQLEKEKLQMAVMEQENELAKLRGSLQNAHLARTVQKVDIKLSLSEELEPMALDLERRVKETVLPMFIGKELDSLDPELAFQSLENRIIKVDEKPYILRVVSLRLAEKSIFYLRVEKEDTPINF